MKNKGIKTQQAHKKQRINSHANNIRQDAGKDRKTRRQGMKARHDILSYKRFAL